MSGYSIWSASAALGRIALCGLTAALIFNVAFGQDRVEQSPTWRLEFANDVAFDSDNQFSNGFTVQKHSPIAASLEATAHTPAFGKVLGRWLLPSGEGLSYREGWSVGQNIITPEDISNPDVILDDIPYMGLLGWSNSFVAFDDRRLTSVSWLFGIAGPESFAEEVQKAVHDVIDSEEPQGWDNQLDNEPVLGFMYSKKRKVWRKDSFDGAIGFNASASNFFTFGELALEMRFGRMPGGFAHVSDPIGRGQSFDATIPIEGSSKTQIYGTIIVRATGYLVSMPLEGNNFTNSNEWTENNIIEPEDFTSQVIVGINLERPRWALRMNFWFASDSVKSDTLPMGEDPQNDFGTITAEWRFR